MKIENKIDNMKNLIELHLHLDGALSLDNCKRLAKLQNIDIPDDETIRKMITVSPDCKSLNEFLTKFDFAISLLQTTDGIKNAIINLTEELLEQGIIYAEIRFAPQLSTHNGLTQEDVVKAAIEGINMAKIHCNLICCCMRGKDTHEKNIETVKVASKYLNQGICAIDLAGAEGLYKTEDYEDIFTYASELNIPFTIHAGEADGPDSVKSAINFGAKRIGHGVRAFEDLQTMELLKSNNITLEICPSSNLCTAVYEKINDLPLMDFINKGINVTINTDDPVICNTTLKNELKLIAKTFNLSYEDIIKLQLNAINSSFANETTKNEIKKFILS